MIDADVIERLASLGFELPPPPKAVAAYVPVVVDGGRAYLSGQVPLVDGVMLNPGRLGEGVTVEEGAEAARRCVLQALSAFRAELGSFDRLVRILRLDVFVACTPDFVEHPKVANGASEFLVEIFGDPGRHARAAVGVASLPLGACVEVAGLASLSP